MKHDPNNDYKIFFNFLFTFFLMITKLYMLLFNVKEMHQYVYNGYTCILRE